MSSCRFDDVRLLYLLINLRCVCCVLKYAIVCVSISPYIFRVGTELRYELTYMNRKLKVHIDNCTKKINIDRTNCRAGRMIDISSLPFAVWPLSAAVAACWRDVASNLS